MAQVADQILTKPEEESVDTILKPVPANEKQVVELEKTKLRRTVQAAVIAAEVTETSVTNQFNKLTDVNNIDASGMTGKAKLLKEADAQIDDESRRVRSLFIEQAIQGLDANLVQEALVELDKVDRKLKASSVRGTIQYIGSMVAKEITPEERRTLEVQIQLMEEITELAETITVTDTLNEVLLNIVWAPGIAIDNGRLTGLGFMSPFENERTLKKTFAWYQGLTAELQLAYFPSMKKLAADSGLPKSRQVIFLAALIDPLAQAEALENFGVGDAIFWPLVDAASIAAGLASWAFRLRKTYNVVKAAATSKDWEKGADMNVSILQTKDDKLAELLDVPRTTAINNSGPFNMDGVDDAADAAIGAAVQERIFRFREKVQEVFGGLSEGRTFTRESFLEKNDRVAAVTRIEEEFKVYVSNRYEGQDKIAQVVGDAKQNVTTRGVEFQFENVSPDGTFFRDIYTGHFIEDDIGFWTSLPGRAGLFLSEKAQSAKTDFVSLVNTALRLDLTSANVGNQLRKLAKDAARPIRKLRGGAFNRKQRIQQVDDILLAGDDIGEGLEFTYKTLKFDGVSGVKLDDDQIEYYYNMRGIMNGLGIIRNMDTRAQWLAQGVKDIKLADGRGFGVPLDIKAAQRRLDGSQEIIESVYKIDDDIAFPIRVRELDLLEEYGEGYRLVKLKRDIMTPDGRFDYVLVKGSKIDELPATVLDLKAGYVPRINPKALYYVQVFTPSTLNGVQNSTRKAVRSFDVSDEATAFRDGLRADPEEAGFTKDDIFEVNDDRELEAFRAGDSGLGGAHGLIYSPRSTTKIPHNDGDASNVPRTTALESIEIYLENTKSFLTRNEWRRGMQIKWENTAKQTLPGNLDITFEAPGRALVNKELATAHEKISMYSGFMDKSERWWEGTVRAAHDWAVGTIGRGKISDFILSKRQSDPLATIRAATFHTLLGMFNPIQLWVQAQGAAVALAINLTNPVRLQKVFRQMHSMALIQHIDVAKMGKAQLKTIAAAGNFKSVEEMVEAKRLWDQTGFWQSTLSSADVEAAARGYPTTGNALKRFADKGLMFFRTGELFNRRMGFLTALDEAGGAIAVGKSFDKIRDVMDRTNDIILNLGKANRAHWQKGFLSIPTQFLQIQAKTLETLLGLNGAFTGVERSKLLISQLALYGSAGVFGGNWVARNIFSASGMTQADINDLDPAYVRLVSGGLTDWIAYQLGANVVGADRGALLNGMDQTMLSLFTEEVTMFKGAFGPSSVLPSRMWEYMHGLSPWFAVPQDINGRTDVTSQDVSDVLRRVGTDIVGLAVSPFSITNQYNKFRLMSDLGVLQDKNGNLIAAPFGGFNWKTEWGTLVGFKPELQQRKFDIGEQLQAERDYVEFRSALMLKQHDAWMMARERARRDDRELTEEELRRAETDRKVLVDSLNPAVRRRVMQSFNRRLRGRRAGGSQLDRQMAKYWENDLFGLTDAWFEDVRRRGITGDTTRIIQTTRQSREEPE